MGSAQTVRLGCPEGYVVAEVDKRLSKKPADPDLYHHWVRGGALLVTQGGSGGQLLHGPCEAFHPNGQLREKGDFHHGLKDGEWRHWDANGVLYLVQHWKKGRQHGPERRLKADRTTMEERIFARGLVKEPSRKREGSEHARPRKLRDGEAAPFDGEKPEPRKKKPLLNRRDREPAKATKEPGRSKTRAKGPRGGKRKEPTPAP
ncbi:MAG: hypothetical protein JNJ91_12700 [Flavobacteriales bacterium]|nr:hypothetical protein [Flavobacteriales bacterium]